MDRYCKICSSILTEKTNAGVLMFECKLCHFIRKAYPEESLRLEVSLNKESEIAFNSKKDLVDDETNLRVKIDCKCGSKLGILRCVGSDCNIIKICYFCLEDC
jgi:hypothetical protein